MEKILIIRSDKLRDLINTLPMIHTIKNKYPSYQIDILASPHNEKAIEYNSAINNMGLAPFREVLV